mgnify:CR=1 FL=1
MSPKLPTSVFAEWVERGYTEWLDRVNPLPNTPTIDLTEDEVKPSTIEIEIGLLALVFELPMEAQKLISKGVFWGDFKRSRILNFDPEIPQDMLDKKNEWNNYFGELDWRWGLKLFMARRNSLEVSVCGGSRNLWRNHRDTHELNYHLSRLATRELGKGNSKVKQDFQKYLGAVRMVCNENQRYYTGSPTKDHPTKPFKKLTIKSFDRR